MPRLPKESAIAVDQAESNSGSFLLPAGIYVAQLKNVEEKQGREYPYWSWEFHNVHDLDGNPQAGRLWNNTSLAPRAAGILKNTFESFGFTTDSDTEEMIGEWVELDVIQEEQMQGTNAGQLRNSVRRLRPLSTTPPATTSGQRWGDNDPF